MKGKKNMAIKFIQLTYYKPQKGYGPAHGGKTEKKFLLAAHHIVRITQYQDSIKLSLTTGENIEICETIAELALKLRTVDVIPPEVGYVQPTDNKAPGAK